MIPGQSFSSDFCKIPRRPWTFCYSFTIKERRTEGGVHQEYCFITQLKVPLALKAPPPSAAGWLGEVSIFSPFLGTIPFSKHVKENCSFSKWSPPRGKRPPPSHLRSSSHRVTGSCHQLTLRWWQAFFTCCSPSLVSRALLCALSMDELCGSFLQAIRGRCCSTEEKPKHRNVEQPSQDHTAERQAPIHYSLLPPGINAACKPSMKWVSSLTSVPEAELFFLLSPECGWKSGCLTAETCTE